MSENLTNLIADAVAATLTPEFIEKEVRTRVEKLITEAINSTLRSYSETGKLIEKAVENALKVDRLDLPSYGLMVTEMLQQQIEATVAPILAGRLKEDMAELLKLGPKEIKLSKIVEGMVEKRKEDGAWGENLVTCIVEESEYGYTHIYLDERDHHTEREKYLCDYRLMLDKDGHIRGGHLRGTEYKSGKPNQSVIGRAYGLEQQFRAMIACNTKVIVDEHAVVTGWED